MVLIGKWAPSFPWQPGPVLAVLLPHIPSYGKAVGAHGCKDNAFHAPGSSQGAQDKCQPRHQPQDRQAPYRAGVMWPCMQHTICNTWPAVTETHQCFPPHTQVFQMQRTRLSLIPKQSSSSQRCTPAGSSASICSDPQARGRQTDRQ